MAIKKVRIRPEGGNNYADVLHPETSADIVIESENKMFVSSAEKTDWNNKADKTYVDTELNKRYLKEQVFTKEEVLRKIQDVIGAAPEALDTLQEIAEALNNDANFAGTITNELSKKVDKITGKQLSTEDYTTVEKNKLAGIEEGANKYIHPSTHPASMITESTSRRFVSDSEKVTWNNKQDALGYTPVNKAGDTMTGDLKVDGNIVAGTEYIIGYNGTTESLQRFKFKYNASNGYLELWRYSDDTGWTLCATFPNRNHGGGGLTIEGEQVAYKSDIPVKLSELNKDINFDERYYTESEVDNKLNSKVDKVSGKGLSTEDYTTAEKTKLANIEAGANNYTHPSTHPASMITESSSRRFVSDSEKTKWDAKWDYNEEQIKQVKVNNAVNADTVNGKTVESNVPSNAKFTDTTYSEISTSEIDAGTSSTLRTISGRRVKYVLDKVQGWLDNKVDKIEGKGLSTEDYTTTEKNKLAGIEEGANKTIINNTLTSTSTTQALSASQGKALKDNLDAHKAENATTSAKGHVQLSNSTSSTSTSLAATANAVRVAYDKAAEALNKANEAFQSASDGKNLIATAITGKGVPASGSDTFSQLANKIEQIEVGDYKVGDILNPSKYLIAPEVWKFTGHTNLVRAVAVDNNGNVYSGSDDYTVRKISPTGNEVWQFTGHTSIVRAVAVDNNGNVYSGSTDKTVRKISPSGNEIWRFTGHAGSVYAVAVDNNGNVYSGSTDNTVRKISSTGNEVWQFTGHTGDVYAVAVDNNGNVYSGSDDYTVRKISPTGNEVWQFTGHTNDVCAVAVDNNGNVYSGSDDKTVRKISSSGNQVWSFTGHTSIVYAVAVDNNGNVYSGSTDKTVRKISSSGNEVWQFTGHTNDVRAVAVDNNGNVYSGSYDKTVRKIIDGIKIIA